MQSLLPARHSCPKLSPMQIVDLLGKLWIMFDDVIAKYKVYKVSSTYSCHTDTSTIIGNAVA